MLDRIRSLRQTVQEKALGSLAGDAAAAQAGKEPEAPTRQVSRLFQGWDVDRVYVTVCSPVSKCECGCGEVREALEAEIARQGLEIQVKNAKTGCDGKCRRGPFIGFPHKEFFYLNVGVEDIEEIVTETLRKGKVLFDHLSIDPHRAYRADILYEKETGMLASIDDKACMVDVAKYFLDWEEGVSCGKCVPCRLGMKRMYECMERIVGGTGTMEDLEHIRILCNTMINTAHCLFATTSSRPVLSAITYFEDEFVAHIERKECPAGVCKALVELQKKKAFRERMKSKKIKKKKK